MEEHKQVELAHENIWHKCSGWSAIIISVVTAGNDCKICKHSDGLGLASGNGFGRRRDQNRWEGRRKTKKKKNTFFDILRKVTKVKISCEATWVSLKLRSSSI